MNLMEEIRSISQKKLNNEYSEKYKIINEILKNDDCFFNMKMETALSILLNLGYSTSEAENLYCELVSMDSYEELNPQYIIENDTNISQKQ